jgi:hypothetical protein
MRRHKGVRRLSPLAPFLSGRFVPMAVAMHKDLQASATENLPPEMKGVSRVSSESGIFDSASRAKERPSINENQKRLARMM